MKRLLPLVAPLLFAGCGSDSPTAPVADIVTDHGEVVPFFEAWVETLEERDITAYAALLEEALSARSRSGSGTTRPRTTSPTSAGWTARPPGIGTRNSP